MRFIDADALKQTINDNDYLLSDSINSLDYGMFTVGIMQAINEQPTSDVVEVVRCKDCKYRKFIDWGMGDCLHPKGSKHIAYDYHYCSYGERKENDKIH